MDEIINKVANSALMVFDLEDYYPKHTITTIDIAQWLYEGFVLKEKDFRNQLQQHNWTQYQNTLVALHCTTDAIVPSWAYMLITTYLAPVANKVIMGTQTQLVIAVYQEQLSTLNYASYQDKPTIIKGCSQKPVPQEVYILAIQKLLPYSKSIMYGEACSAVPLFKKQNKN